MGIPFCAANYVYPISIVIQISNNGRRLQYDGSYINHFGYALHYFCFVPGTGQTASHWLDRTEVLITLHNTSCRCQQDLNEIMSQ